MTSDKARALGRAGIFCLAVALGGGARAAQVYPGCAEPGPIGKVWYVDPVNGKTPADGGDGSRTAPWNSLPGVVSLRQAAGLQPPDALDRCLRPLSADERQERASTPTDRTAIPRACSRAMRFC